MFHLGNVYKDLHNFNEARAALQQSLAIYEKNNRTNHVEFARVLKSVGQINLLQNQQHEAQELFNQSLLIYRQNEHPEAYSCLESLAEAHWKKYESLGRQADQKNLLFYKNQTIKLLQQALEIAKKHFSQESSHVKRIQSKLTKCY